MPQPSRCSPSASLRYRNAVTWPESAVGVTVSVELGQAGDAQLLRRAHPERGAGDAGLVERRRDRRIVVRVVLRDGLPEVVVAAALSPGRASRSPSPRRARAPARRRRSGAARRGCAGGQASARRHLPEESSTSTGGPSGAAASPLSSWSNQASIRSAQSQRRVRALGVRVLVVPLPEQLVHADAVLAQRDRPRDRVRGPDVPVGHPLDQQHAAAVVAARRAGAGCARPSSRPRRARRSCVLSTVACMPLSKSGQVVTALTVRSGSRPEVDRVVQHRPVVVVVARDEQPEARVERARGEARGRTGR